MTFGSRLREYREHRGLSLAELGRRVAYSAGHLSNVENGTKPPSQDLASLCDQALKAKGELITAARTEIIAGLDSKPWQTAELLSRLQTSDVSSSTLESLESAVVEMCCEYAYRDAFELRAEAIDWINRIGQLLRRPVGLKAHEQLLASAGWLSLLIGCLEYDLGMRTAAESTRRAAQSMAIESGHNEIHAWAYEMESWFALTQGRFKNAVKAARTGQDIAENASVHVQLLSQEAKALARLGEGSEITSPLMGKGKIVLDRLPYPDRPDNHFKVDPAKWEYYAMDVARVSGDNEGVKEYAKTVISDSTGPDGEPLAPMRIAECNLALGIVALREGDLEGSAVLAVDSVAGNRQSRMHMIMIAREFMAEMNRKFPGEKLSGEITDALRTLD